MTVTPGNRTQRPCCGRRTLPVLSALVGLLVVAGTGAAQAGGQGGWGCGAIHRPLYPGKVVWGEPECLPPGWRAYPLSIMNEVYVIQPDRRKIRTNFTTRKSRRSRR